MLHFNYLYDAGDNAQRGVRIALKPDKITFIFYFL